MSAVSNSEQGLGSSGLVEFCIFCLCVLLLLQVAAIYRDPSVGNLINIMIVKLVVVHNEQVSAGAATSSACGGCHSRCSQHGPFFFIVFFPLHSLFERTVPALSVPTLKERSPWKTRAFTETHLE